MINAFSRRVLLAGSRIRVLVVDDSVVIRRLVTHALSEDTAIEVVGAASNGVLALKRIEELNPDVITLDVEMPEMNGLEALARIRREHATVRVIMFSTLTERGASATMEALALGADDYVTKASNEGALDRSIARLRGELIPKIKQFFDKPASTPRSKPAPTSPVRPSLRTATATPARVVVIGISTGGPSALREVIPHLPPGFPLPVLVVQHMPPLFTRMLAERLAAESKVAVEEAAQGMVVEPGRVLIAPGDYHLKLALAGRQVRVYLDQSAPENSCRPAVDVLFRSAAEIYGGAIVAAVMTGMGRDGMRGAEIVKAAGGYVIAQDEETSVIWGMPGAVVQAGVADQVTPLGRIVPEILKRAT